MAQTILELKDIVKTFPGVKALSGINFNLRSGEVHAICGENGAGKSTLMKVVCGVHKADSGTMIVNGKEEVFTNPLEAYGKGVSIIFQETSLFEEMTVLDNMYLGHEMIKKIGPIPVIDYGSMKKRAGEIFERLNTKISLDSQVKNLGMAQKQMVEIAKALTFNANIIIFDEPTASLTQREVSALFNIINNLKREGLGIVYISHRMEEIFEICDRVTVIRDGHYISTKNVKETNKDELVADMVGRKMGSYYPKADTKIGGELFRAEHYYDEGFLEDINFYVRKGEILGFAGLAGAGRTELMQSICGLAGKAAGKIFLEGKELEIHNYNEAMDNGIVYVSEDRGKYGLIVDMSIENNISLPQLKKLRKSLDFLDTGKEKELGEKYIKEVGIKAPGGDFLVTNLSGGNQQKVSVSRALALNPKLLLLDEPTRGVDVNAKSEIHKIISELTKMGLTIIMVSSELPELLGMCDRIYVMKDGYIAGCFDREEATQEAILSVALESKKQEVGA
ncbi:MAG: sugar ABC transporter ATP-binding protein [Candidatus Limivivens sp.]|nr:sugar ABC transporter ATP-binding protein [Candidatus Limivivens sp.]